MYLHSSSKKRISFLDPVTQSKCEVCIQFRSGSDAHHLGLVLPLNLHFCELTWWVWIAPSHSWHASRLLTGEAWKGWGDWVFVILISRQKNGIITTERDFWEQTRATLSWGCIQSPRKKSPQPFWVTCSHVWPPLYRLCGFWVLE